MAEEVIKTYFSTALGDFIFDAYFNINHNSNLAITEHPIQTGANISDHAYMEANKVTFDIGMSDVMEDVSDSKFTKFTNGPSRSINAYEMLRKIQSQRLPIKAITKLWTYNNMLIESISAKDDKTTTYGLRATVTLKEIFVVAVTTVKISERAQKSEETNEGDQKVQQADESMMFKAFN